MDFFEHQDRARHNTLILIGYFVAAIIGVVIAVYFAAIGIITFVEWRQASQAELHLWEPELFAVICVLTLTIILCGSLYKIWTIGSRGESIALALGGRQVPANTRDLPKRILLNVVEEMALAAGTPVPPVYLFEDEQGINAFAAGTSPQNAVIGITRGAIETLRRDELQGVIAHEFSHILNGDMRLNIRLLGWLHGILVIALIGYGILRTLGNSSSSSSSRSSSSSDKKGGDALVIAIIISAVALIVIGYVGVFFAQLIKAAVSRQREFLADASAVQFTRNPPGIANALKKIGGWSNRSLMRAPQAEEASHMFFGSALTTNLFATHPPLAERIKRIEPEFDGAFPATSVTQHSLDEIIDPHALSMLQHSFPAAHAAAQAGATRMSHAPDAILASVGQPRERHIEHAHGLVDQLEQPLADDIRDPLGALAIVYALLLAPEESQVRGEQMAVLKKSADARVLAELQRVVPAVERLAAEQRLPVASLALPSLHQLSPPQLADFQRIVQTLVRMDRQVTLFEFAVQRFIAKRLVSRLQPGKPARPTVGNRRLSDLQSPFTMVLSTLANMGSPSAPEAAFAAGIQALDRPLAGTALLPENACTLSELDRALDALETGSPKTKKNMLAAFAACIAADRQMAIPEAELLRIVADALGCPVPPLL